MKFLKYTSLLFLSLFGLEVRAQQIPQYTQYLFNNFGINPALAGSEECITGRLAYRTQWVGFDGAPQTIHANAHGRLEPKVSGPSTGFHGIGGKVTSDVTGPLSRTMVSGAYAYHLPVWRNIKASLGIFAGIQQVRFDANKAELSDFDDPLINDSRAALVYPDITPGLWVYSDEFYAGLTVAQLANNPLKGLGEDSKLVPHYYLTGGKSFEMQGNKDFSIIPSTLIRFSPMTSPSFDLNLLVEYQEKVGVGLSYRNIDAVAAMFRFDLLKYFFVGYSFDFTTSKIRMNSSNTHEVTIGFNVCPSEEGPMNKTCPAYY